MKIMFFAHDPGGANAILPLIEPLKENHDVFIFAKGPALTKIPNAQEFEDTDLEEIKPDFLITGTSANDKTEKKLWQKAAALNIKSMAILDHWLNYGIRFSKYGLNEIEKFNKKCDALPDYIIVMDDFAKQEMIKDGVPADIIYPLGNPHFENLINQSKSAENIRSQYATQDELLITFASEPYTEDYGNENGNEKKVLEDLLDIVKHKETKIIVKLHPKEDLIKYQEFEQNPYIYIDKSTPAIEIIKASDIVVSMTSMFLIEAMILGKTIISYQPNQANTDFFILNRNKTIPFLNSKDNFRKELLTLIDNKRYLNYNYDIKLNSVNEIIIFIEGLICKQKQN